MPQLKQLSCCLQWSDTNAPFQEYGTAYGDGVVETFVVVPNKPQGFCIRLTSRGFIFEGLSMVVFIDGNYQCNRTRVNLQPPKKGLPASRTEVDFLLRQKEKAYGDGVYMGREWRFDNHNIVAEAPEGFKESHFDDLGTIEVLVLRCRSQDSADAQYEGSSSGEDSDIFGPRPTQEDQEAIAGLEETKPAAATAPPDQAVEEESFGGMMGLFDGANDYYEPYNRDGRHDGQPGRWVWHQKETPQPLHMPMPQSRQSQLYYDHPPPPHHPQRFRTPSQSHSDHYTRPTVHLGQRNPSNQSYKRVRFDVAPNNPQNEYPGTQGSREPSNLSHTPRRPPSAERLRSPERQPLQGQRSPSEAPYGSQQMSSGQDSSQQENENLQNTSKGDTRHRNSSNPGWGYGNSTSTRKNHTYQDSPPQRLEQPQQPVPPRNYSDNQQTGYTPHEPLSHLNPPAFERRLHHPHVYDYPPQNILPPLPQLYPYPMPAPAPIPEGHLSSGYHPGYWPMHYPFPYAQHQPPFPAATQGLGEAQACNTIPPEIEEQISPTNTTFNVQSANVGSGESWTGQNDANRDAQDGGNGNEQGWANDTSNSNADGNKMENRDNGWNGNNGNEKVQDNAGGDWNASANEATQNDDNGGNAGWDNNKNDTNRANSGTEDWANAGNAAGNENNGGGGTGDSWGNENMNNNNLAGGGGFNGGSSSAQDQAQDYAVATEASISRELYGPHGPYYSFRALRLDEPRPDAEEEPRYDVPKSIAIRRGSTKQVQPGPGYRYFKKRMMPEYVDSMETPYARFVFKYRTKEQLRDEVGIEVDIEPSGDQEIQEYQNLDKQQLIDMVMRAKSLLGGRIPSPTKTISTPAEGSDISLPKAVDAPVYPYLKYNLPALRPSKSHKQQGPGSEATNAVKVDDSNKENETNWNTPNENSNDWNINGQTNQNTWGIGGGGSGWDGPTALPVPSQQAEERRDSSNLVESRQNSQATVSGGLESSRRVSKLPDSTAPPLPPVLGSEAPPSYHVPGDIPPPPPPLASNAWEGLDQNDNTGGDGWDDTTQNRSGGDGGTWN